MELQKIKDELKKMYPNFKGYIQHTLVAEMCLKWHESQMKNHSTPTPDERGESIDSSNESLSDRPKLKPCYITDQPQTK